MAHLFVGLSTSGQPQDKLNTLDTCEVYQINLIQNCEKSLLGPCYRLMATLKDTESFAPASGTHSCPWRTIDMVLPDAA